MNLDVNVENHIWQIIDGVKVLDGHFDRAVLGEDIAWFEFGQTVTYLEQGDMIRDFFATKGLTYSYYARDNEYFAMWEAVEIAKREGAEYLLVENLS